MCGERNGERSGGGGGGGERKKEMKLTAAIGPFL